MVIDKVMINQINNNVIWICLNQVMDCEERDGGVERALWGFYGGLINVVVSTTNDKRHGLRNQNHHGKKERDVQHLTIFNLPPPHWNLPDKTHTHTNTTTTNQHHHNQSTPPQPINTTPPPNHPEEKLFQPCTFSPIVVIVIDVGFWDKSIVWNWSLFR